MRPLSRHFEARWLDECSGRRQVLYAKTNSPLTYDAEEVEAELTWLAKPPGTGQIASVDLHVQRVDADELFGDMNRLFDTALLPSNESIRLGFANDDRVITSLALFLSAFLSRLPDCCPDHCPGRRGSWAQRLADDGNDVQSDQAAFIVCDHCAEVLLVPVLPEASLLLVLLWWSKRCDVGSIVPHKTLSMVVRVL